MTNVEQLYVQLPTSPDRSSRLTNIEVPPLFEKQLALFTPENLRTREVLEFDPAVVLDQLKRNEGQTVLAVDLGGDKASMREGCFQNGQFTINEQSNLNIDAKKWRKGENYLALIEKAADYAKEGNVPVGISTAGLVEGTRLVWSPNLDGLVKLLNRKYHGDFSNLFGRGNVSVANDAVAGLEGCAVEFVRYNRNIRNVLLGINGKGIGGATLYNNIILAQEPGHLPSDDALNPLKVRKWCGVEGARYVCLENLCASGAGIERIYKRITGESLSGKLVSEIYQSDESSDSLARWLYEYSAFVLAHVIIGMAKEHDLLSQASKGKTAIAFQGGGCRVPNYVERVMQIVAQHIGYLPPAFKTHEVFATQNACLDGAAMGAILLPFYDKINHGRFSSKAREISCV